MQKKKLDELFQEKFLDFKDAPDAKVWQAIEASLDQKKKKRVFPIWWQLGGIAAVLAVAFILFNPFATQQTHEEIIVDTGQPLENPINDGTKSEAENSGNGTSSLTKNEIVNTTSPTVNAQVEQNSAAKNAQDSKTTSDNGKTIETNDSWPKKQNAIVASNPVQNKAGFKNDNVTTEKSSGHTNDTQTLIAQQNYNKTGTTSPENPTQNKTVLKALEDSKELAVTKAEEEQKETDEQVKKSIFEAIANVEKKEDVHLKENNNRWSAGPSVAPVYFNAIGQGSPVNSIFIPNSKSGTINFSYGITLAYAISKKLSIRSGIHKVDYGYDTEDVAFSSSVSAALSNQGQLPSIDYAPTSGSLIISSKKVASDKFNTANTTTDVSAKSAAREGFMSQQLGYLELPVELNYALVNKKFGVNLIGGISSLFLIDNAVSLTAGELTTEIGEANNINDLNFSANMGLGLNYKFSPKIRANIEPIFKYQLNTFSDINGTFRPYSVGVYSGLSFKF